MAALWAQCNGRCPRRSTIIYLAAPSSSKKAGREPSGQYVPISSNTSTV